MSSRPGRSPAFSSFVGVFQRFIQIAVTLLIMPVVLNALGKSSFGIWAAAASLTWMAAAIDLGIGNALVTDFSRAFAANEKDHVRRLVTTALWLGGAIAILELAGAFLFIPQLAPPGSADAYLIAAACMALNVPVSFASSLWAGEQRLYVVWMWEAAQSILIGTIMWMILPLTNDVRYYVAASAGGVLATSCASLAHFFIVRPDLRPFLALPAIDETRRLLSRGMPYFILGIGLVLASYSDNIIALSILGSDSAAVTAVSQRACMTAFGLLFVLSQPLWPKFANAAVRGEVFWIKRNFWPAAFVISAAAILGSALIILFGGRVIDFWLSGTLTVGNEVLWAIGIWIIFPALGRVPDVLLNALGVVWFQVKVAVIYGVLAFGLKVWLAQTWGVSGILAATGIAYAFTHLPAYLWWVFRWMRPLKSI